MILKYIVKYYKCSIFLCGKRYIFLPLNWSSLGKIKPRKVIAADLFACRR